MAITTKQKRIDDIEDQLTPKEWVIRLVDEMQKYPTTEAYMAAMAAYSYQDSPLIKPFEAMKRQTEERQPGNKPEDVRARYRLYQKMWTEYQTPKQLINNINAEIRDRSSRAGLEAALKLSTLQTIILQDAFARTAGKAAEWIEKYKAEDQDEEESRRVMLKELSAYTDISFAESPSDSLPIGNIRLKFPSLIESWVRDTVLVIADIFKYRAAVKIVQDKFLEGHLILYRDVAADVEKTISAIEDAVATLNEYLKTRRELFEAEWNEEAQEEDGLTSAIPGEREGRLSINMDEIRDRVNKRLVMKQVDYWVAVAKWKLEMEMGSGNRDEEMYQRFREAVRSGVKP